PPPPLRGAGAPPRSPPGTGPSWRRWGLRPGQPREPPGPRGAPDRGARLAGSRDVLRQLQARDAPVQRRAADAQHLGGLADAALGHLERVLDRPALELSQGHHLVLRELLRPATSARSIRRWRQRWQDPT